MRLRDIAAGTRAIKRVPLRLCNVPCELLPDIPELAEQRAADRKAWEAAQPGQAPPVAPDQTVEVGLRVLSGDETATVYEKAAAFARSRGSVKPEETDPVYALGVSVYTCAIACVDPDSSPTEPVPFFGDGSIESAAKEILDSPHLGRDGIVYLAEQHELWQDLCNPQGLKMNPFEMWNAIGKVAVEADHQTFLAMRPGLRVSFARFMAALLTTSLTGKLPFGFDSEISTSSDTKSNTDEPS